eukprot:COSAG05_NODE_93_length_19581_cov_53.686685_13_plen_43_part_00
MKEGAQATSFYGGHRSIAYTSLTRDPISSFVIARVNVVECCW